LRPTIEIVPGKSALTVAMSGETQKEIAHHQMISVCQDIVTELMSVEDAHYFFRPVDPAEDGADGYYQVISRPMCMLQVQENLDSDLYQSFDEFFDDVRQIWQNAQLFNKQSHPINKVAMRMAGRFELIVASLPHTLSEPAKASALQRLVEVRFARYRAHKTTHQ
jgi:hypothetical protein